MARTQEYVGAERSASTHGRANANRTRKRAWTNGGHANRTDGGSSRAARYIRRADRRKSGCGSPPALLAMKT